MQLITYYKNAFEEAKIPSWIFTYRILSASQTTGLIELIPDSTSIDGLKKKDKYPGSLRKYYEQAYGFVAGQPEPPAFRQAIDNYITSMASYSIICYLLAIKDRHNGNIMINREGHVVHIDFGFVFGLGAGAVHTIFALLFVFKFNRWYLFGDDVVSPQHQERRRVWRKRSGSSQKRWWRYHSSAHTSSAE